MESFLIFIQDNAPYLISYKYLFLFLGGLIEGMNVLVLAGFIASSGQVNLWVILPILIFAHFLNGCGWYLVGYFGGAKALDKWGHKNKLGHQIINRIEEYFEKYSGRAIMFAKFTFSLEIATMILSGSLKYNLKKFFKYNLYGSVGWVFVTVFIGYFFAESFKIFFSFVKDFTLFLIFLALAIVLIYVIKILLKRYFVRYLIVQQKIREWTEKLRDGLNGILTEEDE
ncbi:MAG: DedA family protein [Candidatus Yanofskybacteria bacterium]|nr:DedA family protein [Candidatus Yanofskybacteria bacterium]